jgi:hypothetical protein
VLLIISDTYTPDEGSVANYQKQES